MIGAADEALDYAFKVKEAFSKVDPLRMDSVKRVISKYVYGFFSEYR